jgi:hypothetical protein
MNRTPTHAMRYALPLLLLAAAAPLHAQTDEDVETVPEREANVIVYGDDPCPPAAGDEVVICARRPEEERYRIPEPLRQSSETPVEAWGTRAESLEDAQRDSRPGGCSVIGSYGHTGCTQQMIREWYNDRRTRRSPR